MFVGPTVHLFRLMFVARCLPWSRFHDRVNSAGELILVYVRSLAYLAALGSTQPIELNKKQGNIQNPRCTPSPPPCPVPCDLIILRTSQLRQINRLPNQMLPMIHPPANPQAATPQIHDLSRRLS